MTGYFIRLAGHQGPIEVDQLPDEALILWISTLDKEQTELWLLRIIQWIRDNVHAGQPPSGRPSDQ